MTKFLEIVVIIRQLRLVVYLDEIKTFRIIMETLKSLLNPFFSVIVVLYTIFYMYALIGIMIFGGRIHYMAEEILNNDSTPDNWSLNNFNDFASSFVTLFELLIVNNWMITTEMYINVIDTKWVLLFFVSFYILAVLIGMNIIVCFAIDMYASITRLDNEQTQHQEKLYKLAQGVKSGQKEGGEDLIYQDSRFAVKNKSTGQLS